MKNIQDTKTVVEWDDGITRHYQPSNVQVHPCSEILRELKETIECRDIYYRDYNKAIEDLAELTLHCKQQYNAGVEAAAAHFDKKGNATDLIAESIRGLKQW